MLLSREVQAPSSSTLALVSSINHVLVCPCIGGLAPAGVLTRPLAGLATVANMGAEVGATTSTFPYTPRMRAYLKATGRAPVAHAADHAATQVYLAADEGAEYDEVIQIVSQPVTFVPNAMLTSIVTGPLEVGANNQRTLHP